jgi:hypothetical protein
MSFWRAELLKVVAQVKDLSSSFLGLSGGTLTGNLTVSNSSDAYVGLVSTTTGHRALFREGSSGNTTITFDSLSSVGFVFQKDTTANIAAGTVSGATNLWTLTTAGVVTQTGKLNLPASVSGAASINVPHGAAPSAPVNGDIWTTTASVFAMINGATNTIWASGNDGAGSGLDADLLDGFNSAQTNTASTVAVRDGSGDVVARLFRTEWAGLGWNKAYFVGMNANGGAGADNYMRPATPAQAMNAIIGAGYESAQQTITSAGALTLAHGLGVKPKLIIACLQCTTAEGGYSIGDEVEINVGGNVSAASSNRGISVVPDATNLNIRFGSDANAVSILNKTTGAVFNITNSSWKLVMRAWA